HHHRGLGEGNREARRDYARRLSRPRDREDNRQHRQWRARDQWKPGQVELLTGRLVMPPAARVTDYHVCSKVEPGPVPHLGGGILPLCAPKVQTGNQPQARLSDLAICIGPCDAIAQGSTTVLVHGLPAARLEDATSHGGVIVKGLPSVLIGGPAFTLPPNVKVDGGGEFLQKTLRDLYYLSTTPTGQEIFKQLADSGKPVTITYYDDNGCN